MHQDKHTNPNYPYGVMGDEDQNDDEVNNDDFTDIEMPGEEPVVGEEKSPVEEEKEEGISFELESDDEEDVEDVRTGHRPVRTEDEQEDENTEDTEDEDAETELPETDSDSADDSALELDDEQEDENTEGTEENVAETQELSAGQATIIKNILDKITDEIEQIKKILPGAEVEISDKVSTSPDINTDEVDGNKIVEGVFDGEGMVGSDGKQYDIPANYASKSKLVEGDILKLTINPDGSFLFKQIGPSERNRIVGTLAYDPVQGRYLVMANDKKYYILTASVTYFKGKPGDEAVILVPKSTPSRWAAVENIMGQGEADKRG